MRTGFKIVSFIMIPIANFYLLESYTHNGFVEVRPYSQLFNIVLFELIAWILLFLFRSMKTALRMETTFALLIGLLNYYVYTFRSLPLVPWDILSVKTAVSVADNYSFMPTRRIVIVVVLFILLLFAERFVNLKLTKMRIWQGVLISVAGMIALSAFCKVMQQEDFQNEHRMYNKLFTPVYMWQVNGFALTFVMELPFLTVEKPEGYDSSDAERYLAAQEKVSVETLPSIIVVMDEAFSDLAVLGAFEASEDYMPYFHSLKGSANTMSGYLDVSVCGGNTANTEFEFLTGNTMAFLPQGSIPYQQYIKEEKDSVPAYLKTLGYETYGMHPYNAGGWDRDSVYPLLAFDKTAFLSDYYPAEYIRQYVSDKSAFEKIIKTYEKRKNPAFIFTVTMQNHGSYSDVYKNFTPYITVKEKNSLPLSQYLSLMKETDKALEEMIAYFSNQSEPVLLVFFGDHQPSDTVAEPILELQNMTYRTLTDEMSDRRYQVPYLIWSNYDTASEQKNMSVNYLAVEMLKRAGLPLPAYQRFLDQLSEEYPVISGKRIMDADGVDRTDEKESELLKEYQRLQYYQLFDRTYSSGQ